MSATSPLQSLLEARAALAGARTWVVSDGKAGDLNQCLGVAEQLGVQAESRIVNPRAPWRWFMLRFWSTPFGIDPREAPGNADGPLKGPLPQIVLASGRRAAMRTYPGRPNEAQSRTMMPLANSARRRAAPLPTGTRA